MLPRPTEPKAPALLTARTTPSSGTRIAGCASFLLAALLTAGCSSPARPPAHAAATSAASSIATTADAAATPAPSASSEPGTVILDQGQLTTICTPPQADSTDAVGSSSGSIMGVLPGAV